MFIRLVLCVAGAVAFAACRPTRQTLSAPPCAAGDSASAVMVQITDASSGHALPAVPLRTNDWFRGGRTDSVGFACIDSLAPGAVTVTTERMGFHVDSARLRLAAGQVGAVRFALRRMPPPCCRLEGAWRIRMQMVRPAGMYPNPAGYTVDGDIFFSSRLPNPLPPLYELADSIVRYEFGHTTLDFTPLFGGPVAPDVSRSVYGGPGGGDMILREVVGVVPAADSLEMTIIPRMSHGSMWFTGRIVNDTLRGTWQQSAYAAGAEGRFTMWRVPTSAEADSLISDVLGVYERIRREAEAERAERRRREGHVRLRVYDVAVQRYVGAKYSFTRSAEQPGGYYSTSGRSAESGWGEYVALEPGEYEVLLEYYPCETAEYAANDAYVRQHMPLRVTIQSGARRSLDLIINRRTIKADTTFDNRTARACRSVDPGPSDEAASAAGARRGRD